MHTILQYAPIAISLIVGLNLVWAELLRGSNSRKDRAVAEESALAGKKIDARSAWEEVLLDENKTLRLELRERLASDRVRDAGINTMLARVSDIVDALEEMGFKVESAHLTLENKDARTK